MTNAAMSAARSVLVLVDYQARLLPAIHRGEQTVAEATRLADAARELGFRVVGTEQNPAGLGPNVDGIRQRCASTLAKMHFDACEDGLLDLLGDDGAEVADVVIAGCEAHVCLLQTTLGLLRAGRRVWVVASACGSRSANTPRPADPIAGATTEYGRYRSAICAGCHGNSVSGKFGKWSEDDFIRAFHTGVLPDGRKLGPTMSSNTFRELTEVELSALWLYFTSVKP